MTLSARPVKSGRFQVLGSPFFIICGSNLTILHDKKDVGRDVSNALILSDESGDLGWKLDQPHRDGGSSRYFVIAACLGANGDHMKFGKVVRKFWETKGWKSNYPTISMCMKCGVCDGTLPPVRTILI